MSELRLQRLERLAGTAAAGGGAGGDPFARWRTTPSAVPEEFPTDESQEHERLRLFALVSELVTWENAAAAATITKTPQHLHRLAEVGLGDGRAPGR